MHERGHDPGAVAHHLNRVVFCLFAEDARLLPGRILTDMIASRRADPEEFDAGLSDLFLRMSDREAGRFFGNERVEWFNGGLFDGADVIPCTREELRAMHDAALLDWSRVEPAILGTLFERGLDPDKRGQLGAHYTDREKILMVVEPVVLDPLRASSPRCASGLLRCGLCGKAYVGQGRRAAGIRLLRLRDAAPRGCGRLRGALPERRAG